MKGRLVEDTIEQISYGNREPRLNGICPYFTMFPLSFPLAVLREVFGPEPLDEASVEHWDRLREEPCQGQGKGEKWGLIGQLTEVFSAVPGDGGRTGVCHGFGAGLDHGVLRQGWVLDPFCGRGTTNLASRMLGIPSVGVDISPVAVAIAAAKSVGPSPEEVVREAEKILAAPGEPHDIPEGEFWELAYDPGVLRSLCKFREALLADCVSPARIALRGIILGALHGPLTKTTPSYFSNQAPRTFAPKPNYSVSFWRRRGLVPPRVDVLEVIRIRAERYYRLRLPNVETVLIRADSTDQGIVQVLSEFRSRIGGPCSAIVTSPPYFGMSTYIPDQWLRNWFLGGPARVDYDSKGQIGRGSLEEYVRKLSQAWRNVGCACDRGSRMVVRFGSICSALVDAVAVFEESLAGTGWVIIKITDAGSSSRGKRQADAFSCAGALAANEIDFYCMRE